MAQESAAGPVTSVTPSPDDPLQGHWGLADAVEGIAGSGELIATITTDHGKLTCKLYDDRAPLTVANFIGLARGKRPWKDPSGKWVKKPAYDGAVFHRVMKDFMIQGGDPNRDGSGTPGYTVPDEPWGNALHDRAGLLCAAKRGSRPNTAGMQFYIMDGPAPHLDSGEYGTIFGECSPEQVIHALASVDVQGDRPTKPPKIKSIRITRR